MKIPKNPIEPIRKICSTEELKKDNDVQQSQNRKRNTNNLKKENKELVPPDGGWGWMVVLGSFLSLILCTFPLFGFGILYSPLLKSFNASSTKIAWIFNVHRLIWNCAALFAGPLNEEFSWRKVAIFGGILNFLSVVLSAFAPAPEFLFFSYSVLGGIGGSITHIVCLIAVSRYFVKNRGLAIGFISLGVSAGSFLSPIAANYLLEIYGYVGASLIFGALVLNQCVGGALLQPLKWHMKPAEPTPDAELELNDVLIEASESDDAKWKTASTNSVANRRLDNRKLSIYSNESFGHSILDTASVHSLKITNETDETEDRQISICRIFKKVLNSTYENLKSMKHTRVVIIALSSGFLILGHVNFSLWIPFVVTNAGYSLEIAAWSASAASVTNIIGRFLVSLLSDRKIFNVTYLHMFGMLLMGLSIFAFALAQDITLFLISVCCWGLGCGISGSSFANNMINIMGVELFPAVYGISSLFKGIFTIIFGPLAGVIRDATDSYTWALSLLGASEVIGFVLFLFLPCAVRYDKKLVKKEIKNNYT